MKKAYLFFIPCLFFILSACETQIKKKFLAIDEQNLESIDSLKILNVQLYEEMATDSLFSARVGLIHSSTQAVLDYLDEYRANMIQHCTGKNKKVAYMKKKCLMEYTFGENNNGPVYTLERKLNNYIKEMNMIVDGQPFEKIAKNAADIPAYIDDALHKDKDFATLNFDNTTLVAAMAILSDITKQVVNAEHTAYSTLLSSHQHHQ